MQHELAMRLLIEQRSEELIRQAERDNRAAGPRPVRAVILPRPLRKVAARLSALVRPKPATGNALDWSRPLLQDFEGDPGGRPTETAAAPRPLGR